MLKKLSVFIIIFLIQTNVYSQVKQEWVQRFGTETGGVYEVAGIAVDNSGNVFVSGSIEGTTLTDYITIKYNSAGVQQWAKIYTGLIEDRVIDMALDNAGNVCVTGLSENQTGTYDFITIKYNTLGDSLWVKRYNGENAFTMDQPVAMSIDKNNNIYVCGYSFGTTPVNYVTIKYSPAGDSLWVARYPSGGTDIPRDIFADDNGNVYVYARGTRILKYNQDGNLLWNKTYPVDAAETNKVLYADASGNIYFAATKFTSTFDDFAMTKTNSSGDTLWMRIYNGLGNSVANHDDPSAICIDISGNVFLTGQIYNNLSGYFFSTIKYSSDGVFQWERNYSNPQNGQGGNDILTDNSGNVYITGGSNDYTTIKYNTNGDSLWTMTYNGPFDRNDIPSAMAMDHSGNIYVTGRSGHTASPIYYDIATIKYSQTITNIVSENILLNNYSLSQNYPNPFNPKTIINYEMGSMNFVTLKIFNVSGKEVETLINRQQPAGSYSVEWDASNYPSGIYFYELTIRSEAGTFSDVKRMILLK